MASSMNLFMSRFQREQRQRKQKYGLQIAENSLWSQTVSSPLV